MTNNNTIGEKHTDKILNMLAKFGSGTTTQIADLVYSDKKEKQRLANRKLNKLESENLTISKKLKDFKTHSHQLKKHGGIKIGKKPTDTIFNSPDFSYAHRLKVNEIAFAFYKHIEKYPNVKLITEYEIQTLFQDDFLNRFSKVPDTLVGNEQSCIWVEVEMSRKGTKAKREFCLSMLDLTFNLKSIPGISNDQQIATTLVKPRIVSAAKNRSLRISVINTIIQTFRDVIQEYDIYNREATELQNIEIWVSSGKGYLKVNLFEILKNGYLFKAKLDKIGK